MSDECDPRVIGTNGRTRMLHVRCAMHPRDTAQVLHLSDFLCSRGEGWKFLVRGPEPEIVQMEDLTQLHRSLVDMVSAQDNEGPFVMEVYLLVRLPDKPLTLEPLTVAVVPGTAMWQTHENGYKFRAPEYTVTGPDGVEYLKFTVHFADS